ncbi:MAG TPA: DUF202 domain-containing protein [Gemmatimonadales bacterium]
MTDRPASGPVGRDVQRWLAYERNHLANERTYAAWLRTGLSLAAVGIAVAHFLPEEVRTPMLSLTVGTGFVFAGLALIVFGAWRYARTHRELTGASGERTRIVAPRVVYVVTTLVAVLLLSVLIFV